MAKNKRIKFINEQVLAQFLLALARWGVNDSRWHLGSDDLSVVTKDPNVIDVCTETFKPYAFTVETIVKCRTCTRGIANHSLRGAYPDLCAKCADSTAQHMNDIRPSEAS